MSEEKGVGAEDLLGTGTWVRQGPATLVIRDNAWVVLVPGLRKQVTEAAWDLLGSSPDPAHFLDALVKAGGIGSPEKLSALLFGFHDGTTGVFGVKGTTPIAVYTPEGSQQIAGTDEEPFVLKTVEGVLRTAFGDLPVEESLGGHRLSSGVIPVRGFVHVTQDPAELGDAERAELAAQVEKDGRSIEDPEAKKRRASRPTTVPKPAGSSAAAPLVRPATATRKPGEMPPSVSRGGAPRSSTRPAAETASSGPNMFAGLFGEGSSTAQSAAQAEAPAPAPAPAPEPTPAAQPAASAPAAEKTPAASPVEARPSAPGPVPPAGAPEAPAPEEPKAAPPVKRRLVSTSLFDRGRRTAAAAPAASGPAAEQTPAEAMPAEATPAAAAPVLARPAPSASVPTPDPPEEDEHEFTSPPTQIAPIDDEDQDVTSAPASASAPTPAPRRAPRRPAASAAVASELENTGAYDDLFGKTVFRRIEDAAVRHTEDEDDAEDPEEKPATEGTAASSSRPASPPSETTFIAPTSPASASEPQPPESTTGGEFIDWVPGVGRTAPEIAQTAARRASETPPQHLAYPQVHMPARPPAPNTGPGPAPTAPPSAPGMPYGRPMSTGDAGQQVGYPMPHGQPQPYANGPANPGAVGHQVGFPGPPMGGSPSAGYAAPSGQHHRSPHPAPQRPVQPPSAHPGTSAPGGAMPGRHASAPHPVAPVGTPATPAPRQGSAPQSGPRPAASAGGQVVGGGVTLTGMVCPNGHANSPERAACRACGAPLQGHPRTVVRPPLGAVAVSSGARFVLDRTAIIGRRPRASRVSGHEVPQLITVPSPQQDISRSHLELRLEGWHVVALDLGTTNGTTLYREGYEPVRLRSREGVVLHDGDHLDLGDDVHLTFGERL